MGNLIIVESELEPNKWNLWFKQGVIKWFGPNGWEPINTRISKLSINEHSLNIKNNIPDLFDDRTITVNSFIYEHSQVTPVTPVIEFVDSSIVAVENIMEEKPGVYKVSFLGLKEGSTFAVITGAEGNQKLINIVVSGISNIPYSKYVKVKFEDRRNSYEDIINFHLNVSKDKTLPFKTDSNKPFNEETTLNIREGEYSTTGYNIVDVEALIDGPESNHYNIELTYNGQKYGNTYYMLSENEENVITAIISNNGATEDESTTTTTTTLPSSNINDGLAHITVYDNRVDKGEPIQLNIKLDDREILNESLTMQNSQYSFESLLGNFENITSQLLVTVTGSTSTSNQNVFDVKSFDLEGAKYEASARINNNTSSALGTLGQKRVSIEITIS